MDILATSAVGKEAAAHVPAWAALLEHFYERLHQPVPPLRQVQGDEMPQPYRKLLVHSLDMTPTLESFYGQTMRLKLLGRERDQDCYLREVALQSAGDQKSVEYGVIRIHLDRLPAKAAQRVLEEQRPLGNILQTENVPHLSWPQAFFSLEADAHLFAVLGLTQPSTLFGRRNVLLDARRSLLADVIEILAPVEP
jgi:chorismate-pyruvate lyase